MNRDTCLPGALIAFALLCGPSLSLAQVAPAGESITTGGAGGTYPIGTTLAGVNVTGIEAGFGADIDPDGVGRGQFCAILLGVSSLGVEQNIKIEGEVTTASRPAPNIAVLAGTATIDLGNGLPPAEGIPFTATVTTDPQELGTIRLVTGLASLPDATMNAGSLIIH